MRKKTVFIACAMLLLTGCGNTANETAAEVPVQEQTAMQEVKTPEELGLPDTAVYNPDRNEYYDSRYMKWDPEQQNYITVESDARYAEGYNPESDYAEIPPAEPVPDALQKIFQTYQEAIAQYYERQRENPDFLAMSQQPHEDDKGSYQTLCRACIPYWDDLAAIATTDGDFRNTAQTAVYGILLHGGISDRKGGYFRDWMHEFYYSPTCEAVNTLGEKITAEDVAGLQETYGYMIAPALQDIGKLDLLQIDPDSPCQDAEKLAEFARYFA